MGEIREFFMFLQAFLFPILNFSTTIISHLTHLPLLNAPKTSANAHTYPIAMESLFKQGK